MRAFARMTGMPAFWRAGEQIMHSVKRESSAFERIHGTTGFDYLSKHPEDAAIFDEAMTGFSAKDSVIEE